ncbi:GntR family transcriptional regulator [Gelatiniphilus marinus]|uniref:GntR family transcriptional regulator n=1 Tax=Gelatiniphilus marinus TaxID=1759464 RepID=A0ABW5JS15_9FLAO
MISIKNKISIPKYRQIVNSIEEAITTGTLKKGDKLPSINNVKNAHGLSRDTVLTAFNALKNRGIIQSVVGKGYYVSSVDINVNQKIFLLFDELNSFKEDLYNSFLENLGANIQVDIFFHHFNPGIFSKLIHDSIGTYNYYVIMPANLSPTSSIIKNLPQDRVFVLDQLHPDLEAYSAIYQHFKADIFNGLQKAFHLIKKYKKLILLYSEDKQPKGMLKGFKQFCETYNFNHAVIGSLKNNTPNKGDVYIVPDDKNLLRIIKSFKTNNLELAKDVGVISYNDTLLKEIVANGITTISTDFNAMGKRLANMILNKEVGKIVNPTNLIIRNSL